VHTGQPERTKGRDDPDVEMRMAIKEKCYVRLYFCILFNYWIKHNGDALTKNFKVIGRLVVNWVYLVQGRDRWRALVNRALNFGHHKLRGNF